MKMFKFIPVLSVMILSGSVMAATVSSTITLNGGQATHDKYVYVKLNKLLEEVTYDITCDITSDHISKQKYDDIQVGPDFAKEIYVNGQDTAYYHGQVTIPAGKINKIELLNTTKGTLEEFYVRNLDDKDTIIVSNCLAKPMTSG